MAKKLLNAQFESTGAGEHYMFNLGCYSSDNLKVTSPVAWIKSKDQPLNQTGCGFQIAEVNSLYASDSDQMVLSKCLDNMGYGDRIATLRKAAEMNVKLYLNGVTVDEDNNPMPYVKFITGAYTYPILHYFAGDDTDLGSPWRMIFVTADATAGWYAGQLYDDGSFVGQAGVIRPDSLNGRRYEWYCLYDYTAPTYPNGVQLLTDAVITDLQKYLPIDPEGEYSGQGEGDFDATSDEIDFAGTPSVSVIDTGLCAIYEMSNSQLQDLSQFLWSNLFDLDTFKKLFQDPMEAILNLAIVPVDLTTGLTNSSIRIGNITTDAQGKKLSSQYKIIDFGKINLNEYWADFADYSPYTKLSIFLPYVGIQSISIDDVMNGTIQLKAYIDVLTGSIQYQLKSTQGNHRQHGHNSVLYTWGGNCQYQIPLTASNMSGVISSLISTTGIVAGGIATIATAGAAAPAAAAGTIAARQIGAGVGMTTSGIGTMSGAKTHIQRGGGLGGAVGMFGIQTPYLILERPEQIYPENYDNVIGQPNEKTDYLKNYSGFVKVRGCNLTISGASEDDLNEIESLLKGGVLV